MEFLNVLYCVDGEYYVECYELSGNELKTVDIVSVDIVDKSVAQRMQSFIEDTYLSDEVL